MLKTGLISVTFRKLSPADIILLVSQAHLQAIEWGGDIHVPHGHLQLAKEVGSMTRETGIEVVSYGSYYRVGCQDVGKDKPMEFERVLGTAQALQAPAIRVWAGDRGSQAADESWWNQVIVDARRIAELAEKAGISIDFEYHGNTLTDHADSAIRLLTEINHPNIRTHWQPLRQIGLKQRLAELQQVNPWLAHLHVYHWLSGSRLSLAEGESEWSTYFSTLLESGRQHYALLEFVRDDAPDQFFRDAETLKRLISLFPQSSTTLS